MTYKKTVLDNGITVVTDVMTGVRSITVGLWFDVGSRDETESQAGLSHFMEHMLFKGTSSRSAFDISSEFDAIGAEANAFTSREYTCFYARCVDEDLQTVLEILSDMVMRSTFADENIETEREVVLEEIARADDTPDDVAFEQFTKSALLDHPLGLPVLGSKDRVSAFTQSDCLKFHAEKYVGSNLTVAASGNVDHDILVQLCEKMLGSMPAGKSISRNLITRSSRKYLAVCKKEIEQAHVLVGMPFISVNDPRRFAASVMSNILGGTMSSRLFQEIRENLGLAYSVFTNPNSYLELGTFAVYAGTRPENIGRVVSIIRAELDKMANDGPTVDELKKTVDGTCGQLLLGLESTSSRMARIGRATVQNTDLLTPEEVVERYRSLTCEDVLAIAQETLKQRPTISVVSPYDENSIEEILQ